MYRKVLLSAMVLLVSGRVIGGVVASRRLVKASQVGLILLVTTAILLWILKGMAPLPASWIDAAAKRLPF